MKPWMKWLAVVIIGGVLVHVAAVWALPRVIMSVAMDRIGGEGGVNTFSHAPRTTHEFRAVVRPSPDLNYSICVLDLSEGPVRVSAPVSEPYTSVSVFAGNTDNIFAQNDRDAGENGIVSVIVAKKGQHVPQDVAVVWLPSDEGLALVRRVILSDAHNEELNRLREASVCERIGG